MNMIIRVLVVISVAWLPLGCSDKYTDAQYIEKAKDNLDKGELRAASIQLKNALQQNRNNAQARRLLGELNLRLGDKASAEKELRRARELGVSDDAVLPPLARALVMQGKHEALQKLSLRSLTVADAKATVLAAQGLGKLVQKDLAAANDLIDQAVRLGPQVPYVNFAKARILVSEERFDEARTVLDQLLAGNLGYAPAWHLLGDLETREQHLGKAEDAFTKAIVSRFNNLSDRLKRAQVRIQRNEYDAAQKDIDILMKRAPKNAEVNYAQGLIYLHSDHLTQARESFELASQAAPQRLEMTYFLGLVNYYLGNHEQAESLAKRVLAGAPNSIAVHKLLAAIDLANQKYSEVEELLRPILAYREDDIEASNVLAGALLKQGKTEEAIKLLQKVIDLEPESARAQMRLGAALMIAGDNARALEHVERSLAMDPKLSQGYLLLVRYYMDKDDKDGALAAAKAYRDSQPDRPDAWNLIGGLEVVRNDKQLAEQAFKRALELAPGDPVANHSLAGFALEAKDYGAARSYYQDVLNHHKDHLLTLLKLAALDELEGRESAKLEHLDRAIKAHPDSAAPRVVLARDYLAQNEPGKVAPLMIELSKTQKGSPAVLEVMAMAQLAQKQYREAKYSLAQLLKQVPDNAQFHFMMANALAGLNDRDEMAAELHKTIGLAPKHVAGHIALARLALLDGDLDQVSRQLTILGEIAPNHPQVLRLRAILARKADNQATASDLLDKVFEELPNTSNMLSVAQQKWGMGERDSAVAFAEQWIGQHPDDVLATIALADAYSQDNRVDKAIANYQQVLKKDDENILALNGLAWILRQRKPETALEYAQRANSLAPGSAAVLDTLAVVLLENGEVEKAQRTIARAMDKAPNDLSIRFHSAQIANAAGDNNVARDVLQALLSGEKDFPEKPAARELLGRISAGE